VENDSRLNEIRRGWKILMGCTLGASTGTAALYLYTSGMLFFQLSQDLHWNRTVLSAGFLAAQIALALASPLAGALIDRYGPRNIVAASLGMEVLGFLALGVMPAQFRIFLLLQILLCFLGVGTTPVSYARILSRHFKRARGLALGIMTGGLGFAAMILPQLLTPIMLTGGWRGGYVFLAALATLIGLPATWLLRREMAPSKPTASIEGRPAPSTERAPRIATTIFMLSALGCLLLSFATPQLVPLAVFAISLSIGAELDIAAYLISFYFGVRNFGKIYGAFYGVLVISGGLGALLIGSLSDGIEGYGPTLLLSAVGAGVAAVLMLFAPRRQIISQAA